MGVPAYSTLLVNGSTGGAYAALSSGVAYTTGNGSAAVLLQTTYSASQVAIAGGTAYFSSPTGRGVFLLGAAGAPPVTGPAATTLVTPAYAGGAEVPVSFVVQSPAALWVCDAGPGAASRGVWAVTGGTLASPPLASAVRVSGSSGAPCVGITGQVEACQCELAGGA